MVRNGAPLPWLKSAFGPWEDRCRPGPGSAPGLEWSSDVALQAVSISKNGYAKPVMPGRWPIADLRPCPTIPGFGIASACQARDGREPIKFG